MTVFMFLVIFFGVLTLISTSQLALKRLQLKNELFGLSAAINRGFTASNDDKLKIESIVDKLCKLGPEDGNLDYTRGLNGGTECNDCPLESTWKLVFTTAFDVLSIDINPFAKVETIFQDLSSNGDSINIIDIGPPFSVLISDFKSVTRLKVRTRAKARSKSRVGLNFVGVEVTSKSTFGIDTSFLPPLKANFPNIGDMVNEDNTPGFFDVKYLDEDCLIIQQNEPGGIFVSLRDENRIE